MSTTGKNKRILLIAAAAIIVVAAFLLFRQKGAFLPDSINWQEAECDFEEGKVQVYNRGATICYEGRNVWHSPWNYNVQQCLVSDIDRDGSEELLLLVWKRGSYGSHMPFWVERNDNELAQHIFIYKWEPERDYKLRAIWMSSAIGDSIDSMFSGNNGEIYITDIDGSIKAWYWEGFGLKLLADDCKAVSCIALGDQLLNLPVIRKGIKSGDYSYMYEGIADEVKEYDFAALNQETVYVADRGLVSDYPRFGSPGEIAGAVSDLGIDVVSLANNHSLDKGMYGIDCSIDSNSKHDIVSVGVHGSKEDASDYRSAVTFMTVNDIRIAMLNFTYGTNGNPIPDENPYAVELLKNEERLVNALDYARDEADCVMVFVHWGTEYSAEIDEMQEYYADIMAEHGVDVVIGTHPHVVQQMKYISGQNHNMLIYYSLGNLISGQSSPECLEGEAATFRIVKLPGRKTFVTDYDVKSLMTTGDTVVWAD